MATQSFKDLLVWQKSKLFTVDIYKAFSNCRDYGFRDQIQRATISIMNNVAEGYAKRSDKSFKNFLSIAKGSAAEVESMLLVAHELGYVTSAQRDHLVPSCEEVSRLLTGFIRKL